MSKIPKIESKSQHDVTKTIAVGSDSDVKDTQNWKQITTHPRGNGVPYSVIAMSKIPKIESKSQLVLRLELQDSSDSDVKDTQNWKQITTKFP